jgi:hypothetical protein
MGTHMKTTIDIADGLLLEARDRARSQGTTLRALVEEGLRRVLSEHEARPYRYEALTWGDPSRPIDPDVMRRALDEARAGRRFPELGDVG